MDFTPISYYIRWTLKLKFTEMHRVTIKLSSNITELKPNMTVYYYSDIDEDVVQCTVISVIGDTAHLKDLRDSNITSSYDSVTNKWIVFETYLYIPVSANL